MPNVTRLKQSVTAQQLRPDNDHGGEMNTDVAACPGFLPHPNLTVTCIMEKGGKAVKSSNEDTSTQSIVGMISSWMMKSDFILTTKLSQEKNPQQSLAFVTII